MIARVLTRLGLFLLGTFLLAGSLWAGLSFGATLARNHWTYPVMLVVAFVAGVLLLGYFFYLLYRDGGGNDPYGRPAPVPEPLPPKKRWARVGVWTVVSALLLSVGTGIVYLRPHPAGQDATARYAAGDVVDLVEGHGWYAFVPREPGTDPAGHVDRTGKYAPTPEGVADTGLVFFPDQRVDSRAEAPVLRPLAEAGYTVVVLAEPLGLDAPDPDLADVAPKEFPEISRWVVGGHGTGGHAAASWADANAGADAQGLVLHASAPELDVSGLEIRSTSMWGTLDTVVPASDIAASRANLPSSTDFVRIPGAIHSSFADYGPLRGEARTQFEPEVLYAQVADETLRFMDRVAYVPVEEPAEDADAADEEAE
ncbi:alpha/beta hydrolase [Paraoerskovia marina]|uniref:alpha/beta hydrolase n=1 Tax=Paraoerskovia marina TaxID=545619 RepID=UPI00069371DD|nr:alpha/beta hydrolase [Paraoerskovia marina]